MTLTLTDFLLARIAEDEAVAHAADGRPWWIESVNQWGEAYIHDAATGKPVSLDAVERHARHIARHNPARVLAECEAKRRIVEEHSGLPIEPDYCRTCGGDSYPALLPCLTLRILALPYADHPDYREEWKP